jgi:hypothetical protein
MVRPGISQHLRNVLCFVTLANYWRRVGQSNNKHNLICLPNDILDLISLPKIIQDLICLPYLILLIAFQITSANYYVSISLRFAYMVYIYSFSNKIIIHSNL